MNASCSACFLLIYTIQDSSLEGGVTCVQARCLLMNQSSRGTCQYTASQVSRTQTFCHWHTEAVTEEEITPPQL